MSKILKRLANEMEFVSLCCVLRAAHQLGLLDDKLHKGKLIAQGSNHMSND